MFQVKVFTHNFSDFQRNFGNFCQNLFKMHCLESNFHHFIGLISVSEGYKEQFIGLLDELDYYHHIHRSGFLN